MTDRTLVQSEFRIRGTHDIAAATIRHDGAGIPTELVLSVAPTHATEDATTATFPATALIGLRDVLVMASTPERPEPTDAEALAIDLDIAADAIASAKALLQDSITTYQQDGRALQLEVARRYVDALEKAAAFVGLVQRSHASIEDPDTHGAALNELLRIHAPKPSPRRKRARARRRR